MLPNSRPEPASAANYKITNIAIKNAKITILKYQKLPRYVGNPRGYKGSND
jgi:hypothetical protein